MRALLTWPARTDATLDFGQNKIDNSEPVNFMWFSSFCVLFSKKGQKTTVNIGEEFTRWEALKIQKKLKSDVELASFLLNRWELNISQFIIHFQLKGAVCIF